MDRTPTLYGQIEEKIDRLLKTADKLMAKMFAKILSGKNISEILVYNEQKVEKGQASVFKASNFGGGSGANEYCTKESLFCKTQQAEPIGKRMPYRLR